MAIVSISRIQHRRGLQELLPQLSSAELGWAIDSRKLYIGNGTLEEGAPVVGNTEILTVHSDIMQLVGKYTYSGIEAGYTVNTNYSGAPDISRSLQSKLDEYVSVKDFGAAGDGTTDDTDAINRALSELYTREIQTPATRRQLFIPAGTYLVSGTILVPPHASVVGAGSDKTIVHFVPNTAHATKPAFRTVDNLYQESVAIGANGSVIPQNISVSGVTILNDGSSTAFVIDRARDLSFYDVMFEGKFYPVQLTTDGPTKCVEIFSEGLLLSQNISFSQCQFIKHHRGIVCDSPTKNIVITNSEFNILFKGISIANSVGIGQSSIRMTQSVFDNIATEAIHIGLATHNASAFNMFYDVGTMFNPTTSVPIYSVIKFESESNVSYGDLFQRNPDNSYYAPLVDIGNTTSFSFQTSDKIVLGKFSRTTGKQQDITPSSSSLITRVFTDNPSSGSFCVDYVIRVGNSMRTGKLTIANGQDMPQWTDDYTEDMDVGVVFSVAKNTEQVSLVPLIFRDCIDVIINTNAMPGQRIVNYSVSSLF